jgi:rhodanese-related sulfurtransferase
MPSDTDTRTIGIVEARQEIAGGDAIAVDVRSEEEWNEGHVPGASHLPDADGDASAERPKPGARLMVIAKDGQMAVKAASRLADEGYDAVAVDGGMDDWSSEDFNVQPTEDVDEDADIKLD